MASRGSFSPNARGFFLGRSEPAFRLIEEALFIGVPAGVVLRLPIRPRTLTPESVPAPRRAATNQVLIARFMFLSRFRPWGRRGFAWLCVVSNRSQYTSVHRLEPRFRESATASGRPVACPRPDSTGTGATACGRP